MKPAKAKDPTESEKQRAKLASLLICPKCGGERKYDAAVGFTCAMRLHEWRPRSKELARKLGSGGKNRRMR